MPDCKVTADSLSAWFAGAQGSYILAHEQAYFSRSVSDIFGFNAAQLGLPEHDFLANSRMSLRFNGSPQAGSAVRLCHDELPFASDSLDLLLLPHVLEFCQQPHQVLREVQRVLLPEGSLLLSGFNPRSLWGMRRAFGNRSEFPWKGDFIALHRLKDWMSVLGFEVVGGCFAGYAPPFNREKWLRRYAFMEKAGDRWWAVGGGIYFLHAVKRVYGVRPLKPQWKHSLVGKLLPATPKINKEELIKSVRTGQTKGAGKVDPQ